MSRGMRPETLAGEVIDAIRHERFWILTHDDFDDAIRVRTEDILQRRNPAPFRSPLDVQVSGGYAACSSTSTLVSSTSRPTAPAPAPTLSTSYARSPRPCAEHAS